MIRSFADRRTRLLFENGAIAGLPADLIGRAQRKLDYIDLAATLADLRFPPGNRLHPLKGDRAGQHAIRVNDQWRLCFRFLDGDAYDVELCDYH